MPLVHREVHPDVLAFYRAELAVDDHFHAVFEAMKSVGAKLRTRRGSYGAPELPKGL
ncbi:TIGR02391 family protein [Roseomonas sp. GCM10028921]